MAGAAATGHNTPARQWRGVDRAGSERTGGHRGRRHAAATTLRPPPPPPPLPPNPQPPPTSPATSPTTPRVQRGGGSGAWSRAAPGRGPPALRCGWGRRSPWRWGGAEQGGPGPEALLVGLPAATPPPPACAWGKHESAVVTRGGSRGGCLRWGCWRLPPTHPTPTSPLLRYFSVCGAPSAASTVTPLSFRQARPCPGAGRCVSEGPLVRPSRAQWNDN